MFQIGGRTKIIGWTVVILAVFLGGLRILQTTFSDTYLEIPVFHWLMMLGAGGFAFYIALSTYRFYTGSRDPRIFILTLAFYIFGFGFLLHALATPALLFQSEEFFDITEHYGLFWGSFLLLALALPLHKFKDRLYEKKAIIFGAVAIFTLLFFGSAFFFSPVATFLIQYVHLATGATAGLLLLLLLLRDIKSIILPYLIFGAAALINSGIIPLFYKEWNLVWWYFHLSFLIGFAIIFAGFLKARQPESGTLEARLPKAEGLFQTIAPQKRISAKFSLFIILIAVIPLLFSAYFVFLTSKKSLERQALDDLVLIAEAKEGQLYDYLAFLKARTVDFSSDGLIRDLTAISVSQEPAAQEAVQSLNRHLQTAKMPLDKNIIGIIIINTQGIVIASTDTREIGKDESEDDYYVQGLGLLYGEAFLSDLKFSHHFGLSQFSLVASSPIFDRFTNQRLGVLAIIFKTAGVDEVLMGARQLALGAPSGLAGRRETLDIYLVNKDNLFITERGFLEESRFLKEKVETEPVKQCKKNKESKGLWLNSQGEPVYGASMCFSSFGWTLLTEISKEEVFKPINNLQQNLFFIVFALIFFVVLFGTYIAGILTKPLGILTNVARRISQGDFKLRAPIITEDEVGVLAQSFNQMTDALVATMAKDEAILVSIGDAVMACDKDGKIMLFNRVAEELTGFSGQEAIGHHYSRSLKLIKESDEKPGNDFIADAIKSGQKTEMANHTLLIRKDGRKIPVADSAAPIKDDQGQTLGCVVVFRDITHEREVDKAKTEFVSLASHQLRTPLSTINWYTEMLLSGDAGRITEDQKKYLDEVYRGSKRMVELVNALLNVSRLEMGTFVVEPEPVDLKKLAQIAVKELEPLTQQKKINITCSCDEKIPALELDPKLMGIIFQNLLSNSVKYTPAGGTVNLTIAKDANDVTIKVSDTGYGIPKNQKEKIFSKLFRADNVVGKETEGTGLGLYIVKGIVDHSGGRIWFESEENKGTTFFVTLPLTGMAKKEGTRKLE